MSLTNLNNIFRSHGTYFCDNGVEETHRGLKHLLGGCYNNNYYNNSSKDGTEFELTALEVGKILDSYHLTNEEKAYLEDEIHVTQKDKFYNARKFCSVQETAVEACGLKRSCVRSSRLQKINSALVDEVIGVQTNLPVSKDFMTLYRADSRSPAELRRDGGFFGTNPISIEHAKLVAASLAYSPPEDDQLLEFKRLNKEPFVITSEAEYKPPATSSLNVYKLNIPIPLARRGDPATPKRQLLFNKNNLEESEIIAVRSGTDVSFVTGLSASFIQSVNMNDGHGFLEMPEAMKIYEERKKHKTAERPLVEISPSFHLNDYSKDDETD